MVDADLTRQLERRVDDLEERVTRMATAIAAMGTVALTVKPAPAPPTSDRGPGGSASGRR